VRKAVTACQILAADGPREERFWKATDAPMIFKNGECHYARSLVSQNYVLYVRFPAESCLSDKGDEEFRRFKSPPVGLQIERKGSTQTSGSQTAEEGGQLPAICAWVSRVTGRWNTITRKRVAGSMPDCAHGCNDWTGLAQSQSTYGL